ncbi:uncharacterized protein LOC135846890 [Planococcus citri]|uniref:uncharacterized protein LOC135846890 n=1 Tax=Planococcus citri TaxID=170843 RepID=UPI0031F890A4
MKTILLLILGLCWQPASESRVLQAEAAEIQRGEPVAEYYSDEDDPPDIHYPNPGPDQLPDAPGDFRCKDDPAIGPIEKNLGRAQMDENKGAIRPYRSRYFGKQNGKNVGPESIKQLDSFLSIASNIEENSYITDNEGGNDDQHDDNVHEEGEGGHPTHFCVHKFDIRGGGNIKPYDIDMVVAARNPRRMANVGKRKKRQVKPVDLIDQRVDSMGKFFETVG